MTQKAAAAAFCVAPATAHRWWHRWRLADEEQRSSGKWLLDRSSRPHRQLRRLSPLRRSRSCALVGRPAWASAVWPDLPPGALDDLEGPAPPRALPQRWRSARETYRRYEWSAPGALLHVDVVRLARFNRPGHAVTGVRDKTWVEKRDRVGYVYLHCGRRPLPLRLRRAAPRSRRGDRGSSPGAGDRALQRHSA
jgi:leucine-zipper of insertion element IS481